MYFSWLESHANALVGALHVGTSSGHFFEVDVNPMGRSGRASRGAKARHAKEAATPNPAPPEPSAPCRGIVFAAGVVHLTDLRASDGQRRFSSITVAGEHVSHGFSAEWLASPLAHEAGPSLHPERYLANADLLLFQSDSAMFNAAICGTDRRPEARGCAELVRLISGQPLAEVRSSSHLIHRHVPLDQAESHGYQPTCCCSTGQRGHASSCSACCALGDDFRRRCACKSPGNF